LRSRNTIWIANTVAERLDERILTSPMCKTISRETVSPEPRPPLGERDALPIVPIVDTERLRAVSDGFTQLQDAL
jgi:hypothetical protein